ncbi:MAG TPA: TRAP transporter substrate-binding protein, partial [Acidiphilium sp.]
MANPITRKQFLTGAGAMAGAAVFAPAIARAARPTVIKFGCPTAPDHPVTKHAIAAANRIKQATGGAVTMQVFPNNELGNDTNTLASVRSGAVQMMAIADAILATLVPSAAIDNVGFSFKDTKTVFAALDGAVGDIVRRDIASHGLQPMPAIWDLGFREITTGTKPVETPDDLKGFKIRVPVSPILLSLFKDLGASPVTMNVTELYTALETHVVDGQENPLSVIEMKKFYEVQKYCSLTNHSWLGFWMVMNGPF